MKDRGLKLNYLLLLLFISILFPHCKGVDVTFLGIFNKKYGKQADKLNAETNSNTYTPVTVSGEVTDTLNNPIAGTDIYVIKDTHIVSQAKTDKEGKYILLNIKPGTYFFHLIMPAVETHLSKRLKIYPDINLDQVNFKFKTYSQ